MATLTIDGVGEELQQKLAELAAMRGSSVPQEALRLVAEALHIPPARQSAAVPEEHLYYRVRRLVEKYGPMDIDLPPRERQREPPDFSGAEWA